jgi:uncharacterized protein YuzE
MNDFSVFYDEQEDILYLAKVGREEVMVELSPGVNFEFDVSGNLIGVELFNASNLLKNVIQQMNKKLQAA